MLAAVHALATIATKLLPMAIWIGRWRAKVSMGTIKTPPPTPSIEPNKPATRPTPPNAQRFTTVKALVGHSIIGCKVGSIDSPCYMKEISVIL